MHQTKTRTARFVCYGGGHVAMVLPLAREMLQAGWDVQVLGLTTAVARLQESDVPYISMQDLQTRFGCERSYQHGQRLAGDVSHPLISQEDSIAYLGQGYADLEDRVGASRAAELYEQQGRSAFLPVPVMKKWLQEESPDVFVATTSPRSERAALQAAKELGVPTVAIVDFALPTSTWLMTEEGVADRLCVGDNDAVDFFVSSGCPPGSVVATGNPAFDSLANPVLNDEAQTLLRSRGWKPHELKILWASQPEPEISLHTGQRGDPTLPLQIENALLKMLPRHLDWRLIVRPHPVEARQPTELPERADWSPQSEKLHALLYACDVVVTCTSTVGLEAALIAKPVVTVDLSVVCPLLPLSQMGISRGVRNWEDLESALQDVQFHRHPVQPDLLPAGGAAGRCLHVVENLVKSRFEAASDDLLADRSV